MGNQSSPKEARKCQGRRHLLLAEDDAEMRSLLAFSFQRAGWLVTEAADGQELLERLHHVVAEHRSCMFDLIVSDIRMPEVRGTKAMSWLSAVPDLPPFIFITAFGSEAIHEEAKRLGAAAILDKPFDIDDLLSEAHEAVRSHVARTEARVK